MPCVAMEGHPAARHAHFCGASFAAEPQLANAEHCNSSIVGVYAVSSSAPEDRHAGGRVVLQSEHHPTCLLRPLPDAVCGTRS